ncbi:ASC1-like protein 2 [Hordeum vulgare]|nr:ASC1-like protein 2 [Hordeum vulgare]
MGVPPIDWEAESHPAYADFAALPFFAAFFLSVRFLLDRFAFERLARRLIFGKWDARLGSETDAERIKIRKFKESAWKGVYFLSAEFLALAVTYNEPWFTSTMNFWVGPGEPNLARSNNEGVYMYAAGFYMYSIIALLFWETRRSDFGLSMTHHIASVFLIVMSYIFSCAHMYTYASFNECQRCMPAYIILPNYKYLDLHEWVRFVLAVHDASDVFLEVGKISKYSGRQLLADVSFLLFVISWVILRLIYFPFWILWSTSYEIVHILNKEKHKFYGPIYYYVFNCLLFSLLVLHIYWFVLMKRMLVKQIQSKGHVGDDIRSDSESEEEHDD